MSATARNRRRNSFLDRRLKQLGDILVADDSRRKLISRIRLGLRLFVSVPTAIYGLSLLVATFFLRFVGENNVTVAFLLYLPRFAFLAPAALFLPLALSVSKRLSLLLLISCFVFLYFGAGWQPRANPKPIRSEPGESLTILTYNRGQHANQSLQPFKNATDPDIIVFQEAGSRAALYAVAEGYEKFSYTADEGEFTLLSRYPIVGSRSIVEEPAKTPLPAPSAARFEIDFDGTRISIFAVHTLSPRDTLLYYRRGAFLWGILGLPGTQFAEKRKANQAYWDDRINEARGLRDTFARDPLPTLVLGDLNAPSGGFIHGLFTDIFSDAHEEAGAGFGYTFPGTTRNPLSGGGPWMRIDYLFCDSKWEPVWCITEKDRPSQHRAVTAQFQLLR